MILICFLKQYCEILTPFDNKDSGAQRSEMKSLLSWGRDKSLSYASHLSSCFAHQANLPHDHTFLQLCTNNPALVWLYNFPCIMASIDSIRYPVLSKGHWARDQGSWRHIPGLLFCMNTYLCAHLSGHPFLQLFNECSGFQRWVLGWCLSCHRGE